MALQGRDYVVIVDDYQISRTGEIADAMKDAGMTIRRVMTDTGVIFAVLDHADADVVRRMDGVIQAEPCKTARMLA